MDVYVSAQEIDFVTIRRFVLSKICLKNTVKFLGLFFVVIGFWLILTKTFSTIDYFLQYFIGMSQLHLSLLIFKIHACYKTFLHLTFVKILLDFCKIEI